MRNNVFLSTILSASLLGFGSDIFAQATNTTCQNAIMIGENNPTFPVPTSQISQPTSNGYDCLSINTNNTRYLWFYFQLATSGDLKLNIRRTAGGSSEFILYGPYSSTSAALGMCDNLGNGLDVEACNNSMAAGQDAYVSTGNAGEVYVLLVGASENSSDRVDIARDPSWGNATIGTPNSLQEQVIASFAAKVVPNPVQNQAYLEFELEENSPETQIRIINSLGQVQHNQILNQLNSGTHRVDLQTNLAAGTYFVEIRNQNQTARVPFVKVQ